MSRVTGTEGQIQFKKGMHLRGCVWKGEESNHGKHASE